MFEQLLLAVDGSPAGELATDFTAALARRCGARVHVLLVNDRLLAGQGATLLSEAEAVEIVACSVDRLGDAGIEADGSVGVAPHAQVADQIAAVATAWGADAVVLGSHRRSRLLERLFANGVRERVMRRTGLPVVVAPSPLQVTRCLQPGSRALLDAGSATTPAAPDAPPGPSSGPADRAR